MKQEYLVAVKNSDSQGIKPGKQLGRYRKEEFAKHDFHKLARREGLATWMVGIFFKGKLIS